MKSINTISILLLLPAFVVAQSEKTDTLATKTLKEVIVVSHPKVIEMKNGKLIYNVEKSIAGSGSTVLELLQKTPGVSVDQDDNVLLKGNGSVSVLIDGKTTYLFGQQLSNLLKSMSSQNISRIEVITVPSSQYDANGNAGVINIVTKKNNKYADALNLGVSAGSGRYPQAMGNLIGNIRVKKINFFGSYDYLFKKWYMDRSNLRTIRNNDIYSIYDRSSYEVMQMNNQAYKAGFDLYLNKKNELSFVYSGFSNHWSRDASGPTYIKSIADSVQSVVQNHNITHEPSVNNAFSLSYLKKIDTSGKQITADANYFHYNNNSFGSLANGMYDPAGVALEPYQTLAFQQPSHITVRSVKADAVLPFSKIALTSGLKYSHVSSDNNFVYDSLINDNYVYSSTLSNHFIYNEKIYAAYLTGSKQLGKLSVDGGIRLEHTSSESNSITLQNVIRRDYTNLFPYLSLTRNLNDNNNISFSITRRINRPVYSNLNPFRYFFDKFSYTEGNPYLRPEYAWNASLSYVWRKKYIITASYTRTTDPIATFAQQDSTTGIMHNMAENFSSLNHADIQLIVPVAVTSWWNIQNTIDISRSSYYYNIGGYIFHPEKFTVDIMTVHTINLPWKSKMEVSAQYTSPELNGIYVLRHYFGVDIGLKHSFFNKRMDLKMVALDIFKTYHAWGYSVYPPTNISYNHTTDSRRIKLGLEYHFGGKLAVRKVKLEEQDRMQ